MPDQNRRYLISEKQVRAAVFLGTVGMAALVALIFFLATSKPKGSFQVLDGTVFQDQLDSAVASITGYEDLGGGKARIDINQAMELVAQRGVVQPGFFDATAAAAGSPAAAAGAGAPAAAGAPASGTPVAGAPDAGAATEAAALDGEALFVSTCSACHQATGQGIPMAFPPLAGHAPDLYKADRDFPLDAVVFGMQGSISVANMTYNGVMPSHLQLQDAEIAAILDYVMKAWGNDADLPADYTPYTADDVAATRAKMLTMTEVHDARVAAGLQ